MEQTLDLSRGGFEAQLLGEEAFEHYWPQIEQMIDLVPHTLGNHTKESYYERALNKSLQVWVVGDEAIRMVLFTQIARFPACSVLQIVWGAGEGKVYERAGDAVDATMEFFAKAQHCRKIEVIGRNGWEKILRPRGFKRVAVVLSRDVIHEGMQ